MSVETIADIARERDQLRKALLRERDQFLRVLENWKGEVGKRRALEAQAKRDAEVADGLRADLEAAIKERDLLRVFVGPKEPLPSGPDVRKALVDLTYLVERTGILTLASAVTQAKKTLGDTAEPRSAKVSMGDPVRWGGVRCGTCRFAKREITGVVIGCQEMICRWERLEPSPL